MLTARQQRADFNVVAARAIRKTKALGETVYVVWDVDEFGVMRHFVATAEECDTYHNGAEVVWSTDYATEDC